MFQYLFRRCKGKGFDLFFTVHQGKMFLDFGLHLITGIIVKAYAAQLSYFLHVFRAVQRNCQDTARSKMTGKPAQQHIQVMYPVQS